MHINEVGRRLDQIKYLSDRLKMFHKISYVVSRSYFAFLNRSLRFVRLNYAAALNDGKKYVPRVRKTLNRIRFDLERAEKYYVRYLKREAAKIDKSLLRVYRNILS